MPRDQHLAKFLSMDIQFFARKYNQNATIYFYIVVGRKRCKSPISTKLKIKVSEWNSKTKQVYKNKNARLYNMKLEAIRQHSENICFEALKRKNKITAEYLKAIYLEKEVYYSLGRLIDDFIDSKKCIIRSSSKKSYRSRLGKFKDYLSENANVEEVDEDTLFSFEQHLLNQGLKQSYLVKTIRAVKRMFRYAVKSKKITNNAVLNYDIETRIPITTPEYLTLQEVEAIYAFNYPSRELRKVADIFVMQCCTGFNHADFTTLNASHVQPLSTGGYIIEKSRQKAGTTSHVFIQPNTMLHALFVEKYDCKFPWIDLNFYNKHLKIVGAYAGITRIKLTSKLARSTCGHILLNEKQLPVETVQAMLGHSSVRTTQKFYAQIKVPRLRQLKSHRHDVIKILEEMRELKRKNKGQPIFKVYRSEKVRESRQVIQ